MNDRVSSNPEVCDGDPCVKGTRIPVRAILGYLSAGETIESILENFPTIVREDILAGLAYAAGCPVEAIGDDGELSDAAFSSAYHPPAHDPGACIRWLAEHRGDGVPAENKCWIQTDASGKFIRFDSAAERFFGCPADQALGKLHYSAFHDPEEMKACANDPIFKSKMIDPGFTDDVWTILPNGVERFTAWVTLVPLRDGASMEITGFIAQYCRLDPETQARACPAF